MESCTTLIFLNSFAEWSISMSSTNARCKSNGESKGFPPFEKTPVLVYECGSSKARNSCFFKPWAFQLYLGTDNGANKHKTK